MSTTPQENRVFVGVNLVKREVTQIARYADLVRDAYVLEGIVGEDGLIYVETDQSRLGGDAMAICLDPKSQGIGLGWIFAKAEAV